MSVYGDPSDLSWRGRPLTTHQTAVQLIGHTHHERRAHGPDRTQPEYVSAQSETGPENGASLAD